MFLCNNWYWTRSEILSYSRASFSCLMDIHLKAYVPIWARSYQKWQEVVRICSADVLKKFINYTEKHLCWSLFLIKLKVWRPSTLRSYCLQVFCKIVVLKNFAIFTGRHLCLNLLKISWKRLNYVLKSYDQDEYIRLNQGVL